MPHESADRPLRILLDSPSSAVRAAWASAIRAGLPASAFPRNDEPPFDAAVATWDTPGPTVPLGVPAVLIAPASTPPADLIPLLARGAEVLCDGSDLAAHLPLAIFRAVCRARAPSGPVESQRLASLADTLRLIQEENDRLHTLVARLESLAITDPLTGLLNRRGLLERLEELLSAAHRHATPLSLLAIDLDGLKCVNDALGHAAGDDLLRAAAGVLRSASRRSDVSGRLGGDEFALILPHTTAQGAADVVGRVRELFAHAAAPVEKQLRQTLRDDSGSKQRTGLSVGVASISQGDAAREILARADRALYRDKAERGSRGSPHSPLAR